MYVIKSPNFESPVTYPTWAAAATAILDLVDYLGADVEAYRIERVEPETVRVIEVQS